MSLTRHEEIGRVGRVGEDVSRMLRGCYISKLLSWNLGFTQFGVADFIDVKNVFLRFLFLSRFLRFLTFFIFPTFSKIKNVENLT